MIEPVILADAATLNDTTAQSAALDTAKMTPPSNRPMLVRDICIGVRSPRNLAFPRWINPAIALQIKIEAGRFVVTQGFIPAWLLGSNNDKQADFNGVDSAGTSNNTIATGGQSMSRLKWILPRPMYLPPNTPLRVSVKQVQIFAEQAGYQQFVNFSARGLLLDRQQRTTDVPYVSSFVSPVPLSGPNTARVQSGQLELCNVLDKPVTLHRLIGRIAWQVPFTVGNPFWNPGEDDAIGFRGDDGSGDPTLAVPRAYGVLLKDSGGVAMTSGATSEYLPFWSIFAPGYNSWTMQRVLKANEHITAILSKPATAKVCPMISMVGYRTERI
jgi:hypothetical protein